MDRRVFLTATAAGLTTACNRSQQKVIAVIPKGRAHVFWQSVHAGAVKASREKAVQIVWNGPATESEFNAQIQIVDAMINQGVNAIALAPIDENAMVQVVERAVAKQIPVVLFDSGLKTDKFTAQVATDNYAAGALGAQRMGEILGGKGTVIIVATQAGSASTMAREKGFEDEIAAKFPRIKILDKRYGNSDYAQSLKVAENMLTAHPGVDGLFASNESSSAGASQALKSRSSKVKMVGFDSSQQLIAELKGGTIDSLVVQHPFRMGYEAVLCAVKAIAGEQMEKIQNIAPGLVTQANVNDAEIQERINPDLKKYL